nr:MAG TPA: hypothetical protein [Caudoviricetes sp.]
MGGGGRVAVLPAGQPVGARGGEGGEPGSDRQPAGGGEDQLLRDPVEGVRVLAQDRARRGRGPRGDLLDDGDGVAAQFGPSPGPPLPLHAVGPGRGGDDGGRLTGQRVRGAAGQGGRVQGRLVVAGVVDDAVGGSRAVGLAEGVAVAHGEKYAGIPGGAQAGQRRRRGRNLGTSWERSVAPATGSFYSYGFLPLRGRKPIS